MGKRGPKPLPTALKLMTASPGKRFDNREPQATAGAPQCPDHLSDEAQAEWARLVPQLVKLGVMTHLDRATLAAFCQEWGRWIEAERELAKLGPVVRSPSGFAIPNPWLAISRKSLTLMRGFASELGLSPSARSTIRVAAAPPVDDDFEEYRLDTPSFPPVAGA